MNITLIGASDMFARGFATWAVGAGHAVTVVGFNRGQAEELVKAIQSGRAAGAGDPLLDDMIFMAMPYNCVLDARDFYGKELDGKIVVDLTTPIDVATLEPIYPEAGSAAQEISKRRPGARVLKVFHPMFAGATAPEQNPEKVRQVLLAGDDGEAKRRVTQLFKDGGLFPIDVGPLRRARELEAVGYLHVARGLSLEFILVAG